MKKALLLLLLLPLVVVPCAWALWAVSDASPAANKPVAVVSLASYNELRGHLDYIGKIADNPDLAVGLEALLRLFTKNQGLAGLDKTRSLGAVVLADGQGFSAYGFVPVTDLKKLLAVLEPFLGRVQDAGNGVFEIQTKGNPLYAKTTAAGWAIIADKSERLAAAPDDPSALVGDLNKEYDLAVRFFAANLPETHRQHLVAKMKRDAERDWKQRPGESDEDLAMRVKISRELLQSILGLVNDVDQVTVGWKLDRTAEKSFLEASVTARPGTDTARQLAQLGQAKTRFAGFRLPGATLTANWAGTVPEAKAALLGSIVSTVREKALRDMDKQPKSAEERRLGKELVETVAAVLQKTVKSRQCDGGLSMLASPQSLTVLAGTYVADSADLDKVVSLLTDAVRKHNPAAGEWIKLNADQSQGVRFHTVSIPVGPDAKDREKVVALIGDTIPVVLGIGTDSLYVAAGRDALKTLKQAIEQSVAAGPTTVPPVGVSLSLGSLTRFIAAAGEQKDRANAARVAGLLEKANGMDHVTLVASPIADGAKYRIEIEGGILKMLGRLNTVQ